MAKQVRALEAKPEADVSLVPRQKERTNSCRFVLWHVSPNK